MISKREEIIRVIASILDHPSTFIGGPSRGNMVKAKFIVDELEVEYGLDTK